MKIFAIGFGQAGGKIVDLFLEYEKRTKQHSIMRAIVINTAKADLMGLKNIPMEDRVLIGQAWSKGHGVGADNEMGAKIAADDIYVIQGAIDRREVHDVDAFFIVAGLGGGTGSGGAPVLARRLKKLYTEPIYALGVLPSKEEGGLYALNAARSFMTLIKEVDSLLMFDNDTWKKEGETYTDAYNYMNEEIVKRLGIMFAAGESVGEDVGQLVVDTSEIINTLRGGGVTAIGYASEIVQVKKKRGGILRKKKEEHSLDTLDATSRILSLVRRAVMGRLTIPCNVSTAERALLLVAGPPEHLNKKGIEKSKLWIEDLIEGREVRGGDYPVRGSKYVADIVVLAGVSDVPRIKELQQLAVDAQERMKDFDGKKDKRFGDLLEVDDSVKPLY